MDSGTVAFMGDADTVLGFRALGVETFVPESPEMAREIFAGLVRREVAVVMITSELQEHLREEVEEVLHRPLPAVIVLPGIKGADRHGRDTIRELVIRAVGVDLMSESDGA